MEDLLRAQYDETLEGWCKERGLTVIGSYVQTIMNYYSYLDLLRVPTCDVLTSSVMR